MRATSRAAALIALAVLPGCGTPTLPCGTFTFTGQPQTSGISMKLDFAFTPATCGSACTCNQVVYVQIVRIIDRDTGDFLAPNADQANRTVTGRPQATLNGWAVDRLSGRDWGYYGRNNDGTFASTLTPGSDATIATLRDTPSDWGDNTWFDAVSVPVCIQGGSGCANNLVGYYYWLFIVNPGGTVGDPFHEIGVDWNKDSFDAAVAEWNTDAGGLGKQAFPGFTRLSN